MINTTLLSIALTVAALPFQAAPAIWAGLTPGPYRVGFQPGIPAEPVSIWYPADGGGSGMTLRDYYDEATAAQYAKFLAGAGLPTTAVDEMFRAPMGAHRGSPRLDGRFPVILIAQGNAQGAADQAVLAEYLASHGFVVATTPSPMVATPMTSEDQVAPFAERQAADLLRALSALGGWPSADVSRVGVVGHSFGARAGLLVAMQDVRVRALVSLDGGIGTATAATSFMKAPSFDASKAEAPILHFYERVDAFMAPEFTLLDSFPALVTTDEVTGMHHIHFTTLGFVAAMLSDFAKATDAGHDERESITRVARGTLEFLQKHL